MSTHDLLHESMAIMQAKNHDYSGGDGDPLSNFRMSTRLGISVGQGIALRMFDKHQRIRTFIEKGQLKVKGESVRDAVLDCINYTILLNAYYWDVIAPEALYHSRAELEAESATVRRSIQYPTDVHVLLGVAESELEHTRADCSYLLNIYLHIGEVLFDE